MAKIFLTHPPEALANYYGDRAVAGLKALGELRLNAAGRELSQAELAAAAGGCEVIVVVGASGGNDAEPGAVDMVRGSPRARPSAPPRLDSTRWRVTGIRSTSTSRSSS